MRRLIICCDGTWNTPAQEENNTPCPTNVVRLFNALAAADQQGNIQLKYYHPGVGTEGSLLSRTAGGIRGEGLDKNTKSAYAWLGNEYAAGDLIYLFGFSRGAYTVRSLGGLIGRCGLPLIKNMAPAEAWSRVEAAYQKGYQENKDGSKWRRAGWPWLDPGTVPLEFIGVWDTVGACGIPDDLALLNLLDRPSEWRFYDTRLGKHVKTARHAVAIDEMRASFTPTLWTDDNDEPIYNDPTGRVKQIWFPGVHCDVGGGYAATGLSDLALEWMMDEAAASGLAFVESFRKQVRPDPQGVLHDSAKGLFKQLRTRPRSLPCLEAGSACFHAAALQRHEAPPISQAPYHQSRKLAVGESATVAVYAAQHWNATGLFLEPGSYRFSAEGEWIDRTVTCDAGGTNDGKFHIGELREAAGTLLGKAEGLFGKVTDNQGADFIGTRRIESAPWFSLIGAIANDGEKTGANPQPDGSPSPHQYLEIGSGPYQLTNLTRPGYLYAFANDAWHSYDNNHGSVLLTVKRTG